MPRSGRSWRATGRRFERVDPLVLVAHDLEEQRHHAGVTEADQGTVIVTAEQFLEPGGLELVGDETDVAPSGGLPFARYVLVRRGCATKLPTVAERGWS